jgi:hypothetical protein
MKSYSMGEYINVNVVLECVSDICEYITTSHVLKKDDT